MYKGSPLFACIEFSHYLKKFICFKSWFILEQTNLYASLSCLDDCLLSSLMTCNNRLPFARRYENFNGTSNTTAFLREGFIKIYETFSE